MRSGKTAVAQVTGKRVAVLLFNLGGPKAPEDVKPFLYNLFRDKYIIDLPLGIRQGVASMIANRRAPAARKNYAYMGGGSPILRETEAQAQALETYINSRTPGLEVKVFVGMRYWHPFIETAANDIARWQPDEIVLLPLYPQFSSTTTLTAFDAFTKAYRGKAKVTRVCCYAANDHFIKAHTDQIVTRLKGLKDLDNYRLLFSAHGLPEKIVKQGDPYQAQVEATVARVMAAMPVEIEHVICYQSRVGPMKWIGPSTDDTIKATAKAGKNAVVVPIAFVSEHIETLVELDIEYAHLARTAGMADYIRIPALGVDTSFVKALNDEVLKAVGAGKPVVGDQTCEACHSFCPKRKAR